MTTDARQTRAWRKLRLQILERDRWTCQIRGPRCLEKATQVHHTLGVKVSGVLCDPGLLLSACKPCNAAIGEPSGDPDPLVYD